MTNSRKGFTLVEFLITIVIIAALLAAMAIPAFQKVKENSNRQRIETVKVEAPVIAGNVEVGSPRFTYEKQNNISIHGVGIKSVILVTDKTTGKQFLMVEDFGVADLNVVKIESTSTGRYGK